MTGVLLFLDVVFVVVGNIVFSVEIVQRCTIDPDVTFRGKMDKTNVMYRYIGCFRFCGSSLCNHYFK